MNNIRALITEEGGKGGQQMTKRISWTTACNCKLQSKLVSRAAKMDIEWKDRVGEPNKAASQCTMDSHYIQRKGYDHVKYGGGLPLYWIHCGTESFSVVCERLLFLFFLVSSERLFSRAAAFTSVLFLLLFLSWQTLCHFRSALNVCRGFTAGRRGCYFSFTFSLPFRSYITPAGEAFRATFAVNQKTSQDKSIHKVHGWITYKSKNYIRHWKASLRQLHSHSFQCRWHFVL